MRNFLKSTLWIGLFVASSASAADVYTVTVEGEGPTVAEARQKALSLALGAIVDAAKPEKSLETREEWAKMLLAANPENVIQPQYYKSLSVVEPGANDLRGVAVVKIEVRLPASRLREISSEQSGLLKLIGKPTILVMISDRLVDRRPGYPHVTVRDDSHIAQALKEHLNKLGFNVIVKRQADVIRKNKVDMADLRGDDQVAIQAMARREHAQIYVYGEGSAYGPDADRASVPGREWFVWKATAKCEAYWTDDASLLAGSEVNGADGNLDPDFGYVSAFQKVGVSLAKKINTDIFDSLGKWAREGRPVTFQILNCSCDEGDALGDFLKQTLGGSSVLDTQCDNGVVEFRVLSKQRLEDLRKTIAAHKFAGFRILANDAKTHSAQLKCVH